MRRIAGRILVALLTFSVGLLLFATLQNAVHGLSSCVVSLAPKETKTAAEAEIARTIFRFSIQQLFADVESPTYYLAEHEDRDATEDVVVSLQGEGLPVRRLSQLGMNRGPSFDCHYCPHGSGSAEFILRIGRIRWVSDKEVFVGSSCRRWSLNADRAYLYHMVLEDNRWVIKNYELL